MGDRIGLIGSAERFLGLGQHVVHECDQHVAVGERRRRPRSSAEKEVLNRDQRAGDRGVEPFTRCRQRVSHDRGTTRVVAQNR